MLKNYLKIAFRNITRHKLFSGLNIFGLASGMACSILIFLWVQDELSFDTFNSGAGHIFRLTSKVSDVEAAVVPPPLAHTIKMQIPAIKNATRISAEHRMITIGTNKFDEKKMYYADSNFLRIFNYPLLKGNATTVLSSPNNVVITEATAIKYFSNVDDAIGKTIYIDNDIKGTILTVSGVLKNIPPNSHLQFDILLPIELYDKINNPAHSWNNFDAYVYFQLQDVVEPTPLVLNNIGKQINDILKKNDAQGAQASLFVQKLSDIHLHSHYMLDVDGQGNSQYIKIFSLVAIFIIIIACINFMNLATAVSGQRAKEVGLRKTVGALRFQLIAQFICESLLLSFVSLLLALLIVYLMLPLFNQLANKSISFNPFNIKILLSLLGIATITGLLSGSYPAFFLSSFNPVKALKGAKLLHSQKSFLRNGLVVLQFSISVILIISTLVIYNQLTYIQNRDIGFNKENLLYMQMPKVGDLKNNKDAMRATLAQYPDIRNYTFTDELPTNLTSGSKLKWRGMNPGTQVIAYRLRVDENFAGTFGMQMAAGRFFSKDFSGDDSSYVVNETALKVMKLNANDAIGKKITISLEEKEAPIIGVVKDFNFKPVQQPIEPLVMKSNFAGGYVVMRTAPANIQRVISTLQKSFHNVYSDYPFTYGFVNEDLSKLYITEQRMGKLFNVFSALSIVISCLGLFGLATFATQRRIKEIGVRKILGAGEVGIVALLSKDFIKQVAVSLVIAFPVAWWAMNKWLDNFAYRINIAWWMFVAAGLGALLIALLTVSLQAIKAAVANPVNSLRTE
jgi:putative ABC transport system permease protein